MKYFLCFCSIIITVSLFAQDTVATFHIQKDSGVYTKVDTMPKFNGNIQLLFSRIEFPEKEIEAGIEGSVLIGFIIEKDGTMDSIRILKPVEVGLDSTAIRAVRTLPKKWIPGILNGKAVRIRETIPINFQLSK